MQRKLTPVTNIFFSYDSRRNPSGCKHQQQQTVVTLRVKKNMSKLISTETQIIN